MGLDSVELVLELEASFGLTIPDPVARDWRTPRDVISYFRARLPRAETAACLSQRAFHRLRGAAVARLGYPRNAIGPTTLLTDVFGGQTDSTWATVRADIGARRWLPLPGRRTLGTRFGLVTHPATFGALAFRIADENPSTLKCNEGWTDTEIERLVIRITERELGVDMRQFTIDAEFVKDLGAS